MRSQFLLSGVAFIKQGRKAKIKGSVQEIPSRRRITLALKAPESDTLWHIQYMVYNYVISCILLHLHLILPQAMKQETLEAVIHKRV